MNDPTATNSTIKSVREWCFFIPPDITPAEYRLHVILRSSEFVGLGIHFLYIFLFAWWDVWPLAIFNIFSVILWMIIIVLRRRNQVNLLYLVFAFEVIVHAALTLRYLGWGFGGQYYLITMMTASFLFLWPRWVNFLLAILNVVLFILFYYYAQYYSPLAYVPPVQLAVLNISNISAALLLSAAQTVYFIYLFDQAEVALEVEHAKSEMLLNNVLPKSIAARLKQDDATIAEGFVNASILFADIAGFTPFSQQISPEKLVNILDNIFSRFDGLVDEYGLEKIKTIGDAYMVAAGIPIPREDHAEALAHFAIAMREAMADYNQTANTDLQLRIGINSGPVVAGVIGKSRFIYDLWGDSVNTASRMESHGQSGEIQITEATRQLLDGKFSFADQGMIDVKGKGMMRTYFINAEKTQFLPKFA